MLFNFRSVSSINRCQSYSIRRCSMINLSFKQYNRCYSNMPIRNIKQYSNILQFSNISQSFNQNPIIWHSQVKNNHKSVGAELSLKKVLVSIDFSKLLISLILRGVRLSLCASDPLMAFLIIVRCSEQDLTLSRIFCSNSLQLISTCSLRYFFNLLISSLLRVAMKLSTGIAKMITQPSAMYFDLNLLFDMISSSPKNSKRVRHLRLWQELQTARTYHLRAGRGHLLCYLMQIWFSSCTLPRNMMQKWVTYSPAYAMTCPSKQNLMRVSLQKLRAFLSLRCSSEKKVLLSISPIQSLYLVSISQRMRVRMSSQIYCLSISKMVYSLQITDQCVRLQNASVRITSFFYLIVVFLPSRKFTLPTNITARYFGTPPLCTTSPALRYCVVMLPSMISVTMGGSYLKKMICWRYRFTKQRQSEARSVFWHMRGIDMSLLSQFRYMKSMKPSFWVSH